MANVDGSAGAIQGENLQLPFNRDGCWREARGFVASLILELPCDGDDQSVLSNRAAERRSRTYLYVLADAESSFENGNLLLDGWKIEDFGGGVNRRLELEFRPRVNDELDRLVALSAGRIHVYVGR